MGCNRLIRFAFQKFSRRKFHGTAERCSDWRGLIRKELESGNPEDSDYICMYRIPPNMLQVQPKAYTSNNISIGPYHHGQPHLQNMEMLKLKFFRRLFDPNGPNGAKLDEAFKTLEDLEDKARQCYMDKVKFSSDEFLHMMPVDGSFIIQLLRDLSDNKFKQVPHLSRWMLPTIRREMIMLENQLPLFVLTEVFESTDNGTNQTQPCMSLHALALRFFYPLLKSGSSNNTPQSVKAEFRLEHLLDLLRSSIRPKIGGKEPRGTQTNMIHSITELKEAGVKIKADETRQLLNIGFGNKYWGKFVKELTIPTLHISDHRGTVFRNIVAFEKCHKRCYPDVTTYMFFFNRLINSADDVALLHYKGVLKHSLGCHELVAELINNIAKDIVPDLNESYLHKVVNEANEYIGSGYAKSRTSMVLNYFTSWAVGVTTAGAAVLALCFTFIQTICAVYPFKGKSLSSIFKEALGLHRPATPASDTVK